MSEFNIQVNSSPEFFLKNGLDFLEAAWRCAGRDDSGTIHLIDDGKIRMIPAATVVNAAFSLEMFLKAILRKTEIEYPKNRDGHNLYYLFSLLRDNKKETEIEIIDSLVGCSANGESLFEAFIKKHAHDFIQIRYYVEKSEWVEMEPLKVIVYAFKLGKAAEYIIRN